MPKLRPLYLYLSATLFALSCTKTTTKDLPTANAGAPQTITLPVDSVTLKGTGRDPQGDIASYLWQQISGPSSSTIVSPDSAFTKVQGLVQGSYIFQLSVTNRGGSVGTDTTLVIVSPSLTDTLTLQPSNNPYEFSVGVANGQNVTAPTIESISGTAWTQSGNPWICRGLVKFDMGSIPSTARIKSATLYLYSDSTPTTGNQLDANYGNNAFTIQQVGESWSPSSITWSNQPSGITSTEITISSTTESNLDLSVDVTGLVTSMLSSNANYGFLIELVNETPYASRIFVGSYNTTYPNRHPKLVIVYQ